MTVVKSPCRRICRQHASLGFCVGCGRKVGEIFDWSVMPDADRARIEAELPQRLALLEQGQTSVT